MKKFLIWLVLGLILIPSVALAAQLKTDKNTVTLGKTETAKNLYIASGTVNVNGEVKGDLVAAGNMVNINGNVEQGVLAAAANLFLKGDIGQTARVAGGNVTIDSTVKQDLAAAGGNVSLASSTIVEGDLMIAGGNVNIDGTIKGKVYAGGGVIINGKIDGDVIARVNTLEIGPQAVIGGKLHYYAPEKAKIDSSAKIAGGTEFTKVSSKAKASALFSWFWLIKLIGMIIIGLLAVYLLPKKSKTIAEQGWQKVWPNLGIGALILIVTPIAALLILASVLGITLAAVIGLVYFLMVIFARVYGNILLGSIVMKFWKKEYQADWRVVVVGSILLAFLSMIPWIGWLFTTFFIFVGLGALVRFDWQLYRNAKEKGEV